MRLSISIFMFFCLSIFSTALAQHIALGARAEAFGSVHSLNNKSTFKFEPAPFVPSSIFITYDMILAEEIRLRLIGGYSFAESFGGLEGGTFFLYNLTPSFYVTGGINLHFNSGEGHGTFRNYENTYIMPGAGIGYMISKIASFELKIFIPSPKQWKRHIEFEYPEGMRTVETNFNYIIKIGFGFNWVL